MKCPSCEHRMVWGHYRVSDGSENWWCSPCHLIIFDEERDDA